MQQSRPQYRINYRFCDQPQHSDQKTNLVCLSADCQQRPLICSLCLQQNHKGHQTKPLKHFLSQLQQHYQQNATITANQELQELQNGKQLWLSRIKNIVETLAQGFMKLQQSVIDKYELIKSQIFQRQAKRSRFNAFYESMATQGKGDPHFQIQNYLHFQPIEKFAQINQVTDGLLNSWSKTLDQMRQDVTVLRKDAIFANDNKNKIQPIISQPNNNLFIMPLSIKRNGNNFIQTIPNSKDNLGHLDVLLKNWNGKLKIKIINIQPNSKFALGVAKLTDIVISKTVEQLKKKPGVFYFDSTGTTLLAEYNHITSLKAGDTINVLVRKGNIKINNQKSMNCCHHLQSKENTAVYFSIQGSCEVEMVYPFFKGV